MMKESDILYAHGAYWVCAAIPAHKGFEVYKCGLTHSTRVARIGHGVAPTLGLARAIAEADRRQAIDERMPEELAKLSSVPDYGKLS